MLDSFQTLSLSPQRHKNPPIMSLPNEIIEIILSYVLAYPFYDCSTPSNDDDIPNVKILSDSPVLAIRSVCRRFRQIADQMSFWHKHNFDLLYLIPLRAVECYKSFLDALLSDPYLVQHLQEKTSWQFADLSDILAVIEHVPSFFQTVQSVRFTKFNYPLHDFQYSLGNSMIDQAVSQLANCPRLTSLSLDLSCNDLTFERIVDSCPLIEYLEIDAPRNFAGNLVGLSNVREIYISGLSSISPLLLPLSSGASLQSLKVDFWPPTSDNRDILILLNVFVNLTTLHIRPLSVDICTFLKQSKLHLTSFRTTIDASLPNAATHMLDVLSAPCLQTVEYFQFNDTIGLSRTHASRFIESIIKLVFLQHLDLCMALDLEWCYQFRSLINLKQLTWMVKNRDGYRIDPPEPLEFQLDGSDYLVPLTVKAKSVFSAVFANFPEIPQINIEI